MKKPVSSSKLIIKNTILMYIRMAFTMLISLITVRVVLDALDVSDYGLYNVVGGVVGILSCLSTTLSVSIQRYISYALGKNDEDSVKNIFSVCLLIFIGLSVLILIAGETVGLWFVNTKLTIPEGQLGITNWIYQISLISFVFTILRTPYHGVIFANERFSFYATYSILESILKLVFVLMLPLFGSNRLIIYALIVLLLSLFSFIAPLVYDLSNFPYTRNCKLNDKSLFKDIIAFSSWTLYGSLAGAGMIQGNTILVNIFFGTIANASRAVALQIGSIIEIFCSSFVTTIKPSMIRGLSEGNHKVVIKIFSFGNKFIFYSMLAICLPLYIEMPYILDLWLKKVTADMVVFSRIMLIYSLILSLHHPITIIMQALNKVKKYHVCVETFILLSMPLSYIFFKIGYTAKVTFIISTIVVTIAHLFRVYLLKVNYKYVNINNYLTFLLTGVVLAIVIYFVIYTINNIITSPLLELVITIILSILFIFISGYYFALTKDEREYLNSLIKERIKK